MNVRSRVVLLGAFVTYQFGDDWGLLDELTPQWKGVVRERGEVRLHRPDGPVDLRVGSR